MSSGKWTTSALRHNMKCGLSFDTHSNCKRGCPYCYIRTNKNKGIINPVKIVDKYTYNHDLLGLKKDKRLKIIEKTGLRLFSFADYKREHKPMVQQVLDDCLDRQFFAKAITKNLQFIQDFLDHPALRMIHLSIDSLMTKEMISSRLTLKHNQENILLRAVVLNDWDIPKFKKLGVDIYGFNHVDNGFLNYARDRGYIERISRFYGIRGKVCGISKDCFTCKLQCGINGIL